MGKEFLETSVIDLWWNGHQSSKHISPCIFWFCVVFRKGSSTSRIQRSLEEQSVAGARSEKSDRDYDGVNVSRLHSSGTFSQDSQRCSSVIKICDFLSYLGQTPESFTGRILLMPMYIDIFWNRKRQQRWMFKEMLIMWRHLREDLVLDQVLRQSGILPRTQGVWDNIAEDVLLQFAESGHPIFRATPLSRGQVKSKGRGKLFLHFTADQDTVDTIYRIFSFCQSVQCLRSSGTYMRGIWRPSDRTGEICDFDRSFNCFWRSQSRSSCPR